MAKRTSVFNLLLCITGNTLHTVLQQYFISLHNNEMYIHLLTHKQLEINVCVLSTVATDALVLKHQAISTHDAEYIFIVLDQFHAKYYIYNEQN